MHEVNLDYLLYNVNFSIKKQIWPLKEDIKAYEILSYSSVLIVKWKELAYLWRSFFRDGYGKRQNNIMHDI